MGLFRSLRQVLRDMASQKVRTAMTTFGILWGTVAITLLLAFGQGIQEMQYKSFAGLGEFIVITWPSRTSMAFEGIGKGRRIRLTHEDIDLVRKSARPLGQIAGEYSQGLVVNYEDKTLNVGVTGVEPDFGELRTLVPQSGGRWLNVLDEQKQRRVAFLGDELAEKLFGKADPIGETVRVAGSPFLVVGVLLHKEQDSNYSGRDVGKMFIPASTFRALTGQKYIDNFVMKAPSSLQTDAMKNNVRETIARKHRFDPTDEEALSMWDTTGMFQWLETFMFGFRLFLGIVGCLTLVVGGIGVSNIMNVVVEERTREIGIKMAIGAKSSSILWQFMLETAFITSIGGVLGLGLASMICAAIPADLHEFVGVPQISGPLALITVVLLGLVALIAGFFPALTASRLDPVTAMKV